MTPDRLNDLFTRQRCRAPGVAKTSPAQRRERLRRLRHAVESHRDEIIAAIHQDLRRPTFESDLAEVRHVLREIDHAIRHLAAWMRGRRARTSLLLFGTSSRLVVEPRGTVLIIAPWNYPVSLMLNPLVAALAAGNCAVLKPSEKAPATAVLLASLIESAFPPEEVAVVQGGPEVAEALLDLPFDHFFFTGSTTIGKVVMAAAARHLATVTLELGGKSPAVVDASADLRAAAERIVWSKCFNAGQTCLATDFVLVDASVEGRLLEELAQAVSRFYGPSEADRQGTADFGRIVDEQHFDRLVDLVERSVALGARVMVGGTWDRTTRYMAPTILAGVTPTMPVMKEEIFGPVLPVVAYQDRSEVPHLARVNGKPLGSYVFARNAAVAAELVHAIPSGGTLVNNTLLHYASADLPFGGVGASGMGSYHGYFGFQELSHLRPVMHQREPAFARLLFPPYRGAVHEVAKRMVKWL